MGWVNRPTSRLRTTGVSRETEPEQLEQVVAGADQRPLAVDLFQARQEELAEAPSLLDLAEDRLHSGHPQGVALTTTPGLQLAPHPVPGGQVLGYATSGRRRNHSAVARLLRPDERVHAQGMEVANRLRRVVTSVGRYFLWYCALVLRRCC